MACTDRLGKTIHNGFYFSLKGNAYYVEVLDKGARVISYNPSEERQFKTDEVAQHFLGVFTRIDNPREIASFLLSDSDRLRAHDGDNSPEEPPLSSRR